MRSAIPELRRLGSVMWVLVALSAGVIFFWARQITYWEATHVFPERKSSPTTEVSSRSPGENSGHQPNVSEDAIQDASVLDFVNQSDRFDELLRFLRSELESKSPEEIAMLLERIADRRPVMAIELGQTLGRTDEEKWDWVAHVTRVWANRDSSSAWQWAMKLDPTARDRIGGDALFEVILDQTAINDPDTVLQWTKELVRESQFQPNGPASIAIATLGLDSLVKSDGLELAQSAIEEWTQRPNGPKIGAAAFQTVALKMSETSPMEAATWLKSLPVSEDRNAALGALGSHWVTKDPVAAMDWVQSLTDEEGYAQAVQQTFDDWIETDAESAGAWLDANRSRLRNGGQSDQMIFSLVALSPMARTDPQGAFQWANQITQWEVRTKAIEQIFQEWAIADSVSAERYLYQTNDLTAVEKASVYRLLHDPNSAEFRY